LYRTQREIGTGRCNALNVHSIAFFTVNPFSITWKAVCRFVTRIKRRVITVYMYDTAIFIVLPVLSGCSGTILNTGRSTLFSNSNVHTLNPVQLYDILLILQLLRNYVTPRRNQIVSERVFFLRYNLTMKHDK